MRHNCLLAGLLVCAIGCGNSKIAPVSGRVTMDGKPLVNAMIIFEPISDDPNPGPGSKARTDSDGRFTLEQLSGDKIGAMVGKHRVMITAYDGDADEIPSSGSDMKPFRKKIVGDEYNVNSNLTFEVPPGGSSEANFNLSAHEPEKK